MRPDPICGVAQPAENSLALEVELPGSALNPIVDQGRFPWWSNSSGLVSC